VTNDEIIAEIVEVFDTTYREIAVVLTHQADELDAIAEETASLDPLKSAYAAGAASGLRSMIRAFDNKRAG
jgi:hypothetical protein